MPNPQLASLTFNPQNQNLEQVDLALKNILNRIGCEVPTLIFYVALQHGFTSLSSPPCFCSTHPVTVSSQSLQR
jgi:hypothetical protein